MTPPLVVQASRRLFHVKHPSPVVWRLHGRTGPAAPRLIAHAAVSMRAIEHGPQVRNKQVVLQQYVEYATSVIHSGSVTAFPTPHLDRTYSASLRRSNPPARPRSSTDAEVSLARPSGVVGAIGERGPTAVATR